MVVLDVTEGNLTASTNVSGENIISYISVHKMQKVTVLQWRCKQHCHSERGFGTQSVLAHNNVISKKFITRYTFGHHKVGDSKHISVMCFEPRSNQTHMILASDLNL